MTRLAVRSAIATCVLAAGSCAAAQIQFGDRAPEPHKLHVSLLTDSVETTPGMPREVELRFRVEAGYHINSHAPKDELLIPTELKLDSVPGLKIAGEEYPAGAAFRLEVGSGETLDVYQNEFRVRVRLTAQRGTNELTGGLRYQACDSSSCYPPRTLPVKVLVTAK